MKRRGLFVALFGLPVVAAAPAVAAPREVRLRLSVDASALREQMYSLGYAEPCAEAQTLEDRLTSERFKIVARENSAALEASMQTTGEAIANLRSETASLRLFMTASRVA